MGPLVAGGPMSGIAGLIHFSGEAPHRDEGAQLSSGVAHRGRDDKGTFAEGPALLVYRTSRDQRGARRASAPQPGPIIALIDGLATDRAGRTVEQRWPAEGAAALPELEGAFALAVWERGPQVLGLARDAVGSRPLDWARQGRRFAFASELPPLLRLSWVSRDIAVEHLAEYLSFRYLHAPRTLIQSVRAVPPGHVLRVDASGESLRPWWQAPWAAVGAPIPNDKALVEQIDGALASAVHQRARGAEPVAVLASGGLDSSAILFHARAVQPNLTAFTVSLSDDPTDEAPFAARVAAVLNVEHHPLRISHSAIIDGVEAASQGMGQPLPSAAAVLQHALFAQIRPVARVILSGDGGDEILGGRGLDQIARRIRRARALGLLPPPARDLLRALADRAGRHDLGATAGTFGRDRSVGGSRVFHSAERFALLRDPGLVRPGIRRTVLDPFYQEVDTDPINAILHVWQRGWLPEDSLARSDRMGALAGVDVRYPLLDRAVLRQSAALPGGAKVHARGLEFITKWPLRKAMEARLPAHLVHRPKRSLPNPLSVWLRTAGADFLRGAVEGVCQDDADLFVPAHVRGLAAAHLAGTANHGLQLWTLTLFHLWRKSLGRSLQSG